jgi:hypothetical protein
MSLTAVVPAPVIRVTQTGLLHDQVAGFGLPGLWRGYSATSNIRGYQ